MSVGFQAPRKLRKNLCVLKDDLNHLAFYLFQTQLTIFLFKNYFVHTFPHENKLEFIIVIATMYFKTDFEPRQKIMIVVVPAGLLCSFLGRGGETRFNKFSLLVLTVEM